MADIALNEMAYDALTGIGCIGTGHNITALAEMTGVRIAVGVQKTAIIPLTQIMGLLVEEDKLVVGLFFELSGGTNGFMQILFRETSALALADILMRREVGSSTTLSEMDESALMESGNILASAFSDAWAELSGVTLLSSPPMFAFDMAGVVTKQLLTTVGTTVDNAIVFKMIFKGDSDLFSGHFLMLPHPESLKNVLSGLKYMTDNI